MPKSFLQKFGIRIMTLLVIIGIFLNANLTIAQQTLYEDPDNNLLTGTTQNVPPPADLDYGTSTPQQQSTPPISTANNAAPTSAPSKPTPPKPAAAPAAAPTTTTPDSAPAATTETPVANNLDNTGLRAFPLKYLNVQPGGTPGIQGTQGREYLQSKNPAAAFVLQVINFIALTIASLSFLAIVIAGFMILVSAGDANSVNQGKTVITHAAIGLAITLSAYYIVAFVQSILFETIS